MADREPTVFVSFSIPVSQRGEIARMARRLGCARVEILLAEAAKIGLRVMEQRFEPSAKAMNIAARAAQRRLRCR